MKRKRVAVTGIGMLSPLGNTVAETWQGLIAGQSGIGRITAFDPTNFRSQIAGEVKNFDPYQALVDLLPAKEIKNTDRLMHLSLAAAEQAISDSNIFSQSIDRREISVIAGVGFLGISTLEKEIRKLAEKGPRHISPFTIPAVLSNLVSGQISIAFGIKGFNMTVSTACASGAHAIGLGVRAIQRGEASALLCLGAEAAIAPICLAGFASMRALSVRNDDPPRASRPFDKDRDGFVIAEGSGALLLEDMERARARGAAIYGEIAGFAQNSDAFDITNPTIEGPRDCMRAALADAGIEPSAIDYINAHGTSTPEGDKNEAAAIGQVFGADIAKLSISSTKSGTGHLLGAAGAVEAIFCLLASYNNIVPPNINLEEADQSCRFLHIPSQAEKKEIRYALSNSFGFGGTNATLVFKGLHRVKLKELSGSFLFYGRMNPWRKRFF